jgi:hypothetical protein
MSTKKAFLKFKEEGLIIGRLLAEYADIELSLLYCVNAVRNDFDTTFKAMFKSRGETHRIELADIFGRQYYHSINLGTQFEMAIGSVKFCKNIRNQYSHCIWWDDNSGCLAFANLEEIAKTNAQISDLNGLEVKHIDLATLNLQETYFEYTDNSLTWLNYEGQRLAGKPSIPQRPAPKQLKQPPLCMN